MKCLRKSYYVGAKSDHFDGVRFFNPWNPQKSSLWTALRWKMTSQRRPWPNEPQVERFDIPPARVEGNQLRVSFVGHATVLIQTLNLNILTDPVWSCRASPFKRLGPTRYRDPGIRFEELPVIDVVLISHNHYDHLDIATIKSLWSRDRPRIVVPLGNDAIIQAADPSIHVDALDWNQSIDIGHAVKIHLMPTQHWSARGLSDKNKALWGAFVIETKGGNIYFCGDSGYEQTIFRKAAERFGSFRFAMLPIGAFEPRWFMKYAHMNPEEAVLAYKDLGEPNASAIHFETFRLADEGFNDPRNLLMQACGKHGVDPQKFRAPVVGEAWIVPI